jgi:hypothetical protein
LSDVPHHGRRCLPEPGGRRAHEEVHDREPAAHRLEDAQFADNKSAQAEIAGTKANPFFVIVDPHTGAKIDTFKLSGGFTEWEGKWKVWLETVLEQTKRR